jgi:hypothetical protein
MNNFGRAIEIQSIAATKSLVLRRFSYKGSSNDWRDSNSCVDLLSTIATKFQDHANGNGGLAVAAVRYHLVQDLLRVSVPSAIL